MKQFCSPFQVDSGEVSVVTCQLEQSHGLPDFSQLLFVPLALCLFHAAKLRYLLHLPPLMGFQTLLHSHLYTLRSPETTQNLLSVPPFLSGVWRHHHLSPQSGKTPIIPVSGAFFPVACFSSSAVHHGRHRAGLRCLMSAQHLECTDCVGNRHRERCGSVLLCSPVAQR